MTLCVAFAYEGLMLRFTPAASRFIDQGTGFWFRIRVLHFGVELMYQLVDVKFEN